MKKLYIYILFGILHSIHSKKNQPLNTDDKKYHTQKRLPLRGLFFRVAITIGIVGIASIALPQSLHTCKRFKGPSDHYEAPKDRVYTPQPRNSSRIDRLPADDMKVDKTVTAEVHTLNPSTSDNSSRIDRHPADGMKADKTVIAEVHTVNCKEEKSNSLKPTPVTLSYDDSINPKRRSDPKTTSLSTSDTESLSSSTSTHHRDPQKKTSTDTSRIEPSNPPTLISLTSIATPELSLTEKIDAQISKLEPLEYQFMLEFAKENKSSLEFTAQLIANFQKQVKSILSLLQSDDSPCKQIITEEWCKIVLSKPETLADMENIFAKVNECRYLRDTIVGLNAVIISQYLYNSASGSTLLAQASYYIPEIKNFFESIKLQFTSPQSITNAFLNDFIDNQKPGLELAKELIKLELACYTRDLGALLHADLKRLGVDVELITNKEGILQIWHVIKAFRLSCGVRRDENILSASSLLDSYYDLQGTHALIAYKTKTYRRSDCDKISQALLLRQAAIMEAIKKGNINLTKKILEEYEAIIVDMKLDMETLLEAVYGECKAKHTIDSLKQNIEESERVISGASSLKTEI